MNNNTAITSVQLKLRQGTLKVTHGQTGEVLHQVCTGAPGNAEMFVSIDNGVMKVVVNEDVYKLPNASQNFDNMLHAVHFKPEWNAIWDAIFGY